MSIVVVTTISCDASILLYASCQFEVGNASALSDVDCRMCGGIMQFERRCEAAISHHRDAVLIRAIVENKDGWRCEDRRGGGGRDFCPKHVHLANPARSALPASQTMNDL